MAGAGPGEKPPRPPAGLPAAATAAPGGGDTSLLGAGGLSDSGTGVRGVVVRRAPHDRVIGEEEESGRPTPTASVTGQRVGDADDTIPSAAALRADTARFLANLTVVDHASSSATVPARQPSTEVAPTASELLDPKSKECLLDMRPDSEDPLFTQTQVRPRGDVGVIGYRRPGRGAADAPGADSAATMAMVPRALGAQLERAPQPHGALLPSLYQPSGPKGFVQPDRDRRLALASHGRHSRAPSPANLVMISQADVDRGWAALQQATIERDMLIRQNHDLATALQEAAGRTQGLQQECQFLRQELQRHQTQRGSGVAGQHECWDCFSRPAEVVAVPCLHKCLCNRCYVKRHTCPYCGLCWLHSLEALFGSFRFEGVWRGLRGIKSPTSQNPPQSPQILSNPLVGGRGINRTSNE
ncbi:uncharacterized protein LOC119352974 [Triticum dicoccoides]|uniref:uncharacterized protein LOC119352974 n=1 Tax=Triticum dicoccoides TaxID=85692 RepID=UPI00188E5333|nr:uncharacterized protein LOC119352974 [Triticum dicoccoides]